jgi:hypothetical protein
MLRSYLMYSDRKQDLKDPYCEACLNVVNLRIKSLGLVSFHLFSRSEFIHASQTVKYRRDHPAPIPFSLGRPWTSFKPADNIVFNEVGYFAEGYGVYLSDLQKGYLDSPNTSYYLPRIRICLRVRSHALQRCCSQSLY